MEKSDSTWRKLMRVSAVAGAVRGCIWGAVASGALALAARALPAIRPTLPSIPPVAALAAVPLCVVAYAAAAAIAARRIRRSARTYTEDASHAGGLMLVSEMDGAAAWGAPGETPARVRYRFLRDCPALVASLAFAAFCAFAPDKWFMRPEAPVATRRVAELAEKLEAEVDALLADDLLPEEDAEDLAKELKRVALASDDASPGPALEALDRLESRMQEILARTAINERRLLQDQSGACSDDASALAAANQALSDMLSQCPPTVDPTEGTETCPSCGRPDCDGNCGGEGEPQLGSGSPERGRDDAPMGWRAPVAMNGSEFKDIVRDGEFSGEDDPSKVGESLDEYGDPAAAVAPSAAIQSSQGASGRTATHAVLPRHRRTIERFYKPQEK